MNKEEIDINEEDNEMKSPFLIFMALILMGIAYFSLFIFVFQTEVMYMYIIIILDYICIVLNFLTKNKTIRILSIFIFILFIVLSVYYYAFSTRFEAKYILKKGKNISYDNMTINKETKYYNYLLGKSYRSLTIYDNKNNMEYKVYYNNIKRNWKIKNITRLEYKIENYLTKKYNESFTIIEKKEEKYEEKCENFDGCWPVKDKNNYYKIYRIKSNSSNIEFAIKYTCTNGKGSFTDNYIKKRIDHSYSNNN